MTFRIPAGHHRSRPFRFGLWWRRSHFSWAVKFDESCRYDLGSNDQLDTNKLVGVGYLPHHHKESARFGWRYDAEIERIVILAYCYVKGQRIIQSLCSCVIGKEYDLNLKVLGSCYYLSVHERGSVPTLGFTWIDKFHNNSITYRLGVYFGGNQVAPHSMRIELKKLG